MNLNDIVSKTTYLDSYKKSSVMHEETESQHIFIFLDEEPYNPRDDDNLGTMLYHTGQSGYILGDRGFRDLNPSGVPSKINGKKIVGLPVYAYIHSGVSISTTPFNCNWDSGQCGYIFADYDKIKSEYGWKTITKKRKKQIEKYLISEVELFNQYLSGSVYDFKTFDKATGEEINSCWGLYDSPTNIVESVKRGDY